jgi:hypothetical protein
MDRRKVYCMSREGVNAYYRVVFMCGLMMPHHSPSHVLPVLHLHGVETKQRKRSRVCSLIGH